VVVRARDLGSCLGVDCLGPGLLPNGRVAVTASVVSTETTTRVVNRTWWEKAEALATRLRDESLQEPP